MNHPLEKHADTEPVNIEHVIERLREMLLDTAKHLISSSHDMTDPLNQSFVENPDSPAEHSPRWHQHGVLTHSEMFRKFIADIAPQLLEQWGLWDKAKTVLSEEIDGVSKADLLQVVALVHDLGKFTARTFDHNDDGSVLARFNRHEAHSGEIIRTTFKETLEELGLSEAQIEYIAQCAEHHFDLGKARQASIDAGGYTLAYARSEAFKEEAQRIMALCPELGLEIGLMFMADSVSKTEVAAIADTDEEIEAQRPALEQEIADKKLSPLLINQALQQPVNMEIGREYLREWATSQAV